ncbi:hypothetical protein NQZ68_035038 [Dissostichus eleginoides]|nr:hypothetical protein NQZ68_035038 [Dissostichus eleginoides]
MLLILWITFAFCRPCLAIQLSKTHLSDSTNRYGEEPRPLRCYSREAMLELQCDRPPTNTPSHLCSLLLDEIPREPLRNTRKKTRKEGRRSESPTAEIQPATTSIYHSHKPALIEQQRGHTKDIQKYPDSAVFEQTGMRTRGKPEEAHPHPAPAPRTRTPHPYPHPAPAPRARTRTAHRTPHLHPAPRTRTPHTHPAPAPRTAPRTCTPHTHPAPAPRTRTPHLHPNSD